STSAHRLAAALTSSYRPGWAAPTSRKPVPKSVPQARWTSWAPGSERPCGAPRQRPDRLDVNEPPDGGSGEPVGLGVAVGLGSALVLALGAALAAGGGTALGAGLPPWPVASRT